MKTLLKSLMRYLAQLAASEGGELLSVRRKAHLLEAQRYFRLAEQNPPAPATTQAARMASWARCHRIERHAHSHAKPAR